VTTRDRSSGRDVCFAGSRVRLEFNGSGAGELIDFLFHDMPQDGGPEPHVTIRVNAAEDGELSFVEDDLAGYHDHGRARDLASALQDRVAFHLSDRSRGGLLFHAAAVSWRRCCLVMPGASGAGKTTLTAWLVRKGFTYLTDELVYVPFGGRSVQPLTRPLNVKTAGRTALAGTVVDFDAAPAILSGSRVTLAPAAALGDTAANRTGEIAAIVFPRYEPGVRMEAEPLPRAQTAMNLMGGLINARNLPGHGFAEVAKLAREISGWRLRYSAVDQIEHWADELQRAFTDRVG
jgi:hypothetical protein